MRNKKFTGTSFYLISFLVKPRTQQQLKNSNLCKKLRNEVDFVTDVMKPGMRVSQPHPVTKNLHSSTCCIQRLLQPTAKSGLFKSKTLPLNERKMYEQPIHLGSRMVGGVAL